MARQSPNLSVRLRKLEAARVRAKKIPAKQMLSSKPMAELLAMTWVSLRDWCNDIDGFEASGAFVRGGNGIEWEFRPHATIKFLIDHFRKVSKNQDQQNRKLSKAVGIDLPSDESYSPAETRDQINLTTTVVSFREKTGYYVPAKEVSDFLEAYNEATVSGILGVKTKVDPNGNLPADIRESVDHFLRLVAAHTHEMAAKKIEVWRAGIKSG